MYLRIGEGYDFGQEDVAAVSIFKDKDIVSMLNDNIIDFRNFTV